MFPNEDSMYVMASWLNFIFGDAFKQFFFNFTFYCLDFCSIASEFFHYTHSFDCTFSIALCRKIESNVKLSIKAPILVHMKRRTRGFAANLCVCAKKESTIVKERDGQQALLEPDLDTLIVA